MRVFFAPETNDHAPQFFLQRGRVVANEERPERAARLLGAVEALGLSPQSPPVAPEAALTAVHTPRYLDFLDNASAQWQALEASGAEVVGNVQPRLPGASYPAGIVGRAGWHMGDLACPLGPRTAVAARRAADCAVAAAAAVAGGDGTAYALARPPGHHAAAEIAGGHCFLNNAAVAAAALLAAGARPAIVDIDTHHGNGTQAIFYDRSDVLTVSIHADPASFYPFFTGTRGEVGQGAGEGFNVNMPLPQGAGEEAWLAAVADGLAEAARFGADVIVLALGFDVYSDDPLSGLAVSTDGIARAGALVGAATTPMVVTQEGGYLSAALGENAGAFFSAFLGERSR